MSEAAKREVSAEAAAAARAMAEEGLKKRLEEVCYTYNGLRCHSFSLLSFAKSVQ